MPWSSPLLLHAAFSCHSPSLSGSARSSLVITVLKFPRFHLSARRDVVFISLLCKFVIFLSQFVIMFYHCRFFFLLSYHCTNQLNQFQMDQWDFFFSFTSERQKKATWWRSFSFFFFPGRLKYSLITTEESEELITRKHYWMSQPVWASPTFTDIRVFHGTCSCLIYCHFSPVTTRTDDIMRGCDRKWFDIFRLVIQTMRRKHFIIDC